MRCLLLLIALLLTEFLQASPVATTDTAQLQRHVLALTSIAAPGTGRNNKATGKSLYAGAGAKGIFSFPLFYLLQAFLFWELIPSVAYLLLYLLSLPVSGFFTQHYWHAFQRAKGKWLLSRQFSESKDQIVHLRQQLQQIVNTLEQAKKHYLKAH
ncbi:hypothetical protein FVR03_19770 [Pontibacter qinzhouensis]|uniref:Uncharacterized protein n=1 Tax=Pontibacter qinzhouensis TaxID=2603253 RepID=A0A5C8J680_9BACT|nr:hypothetical protein [Pontibacter qinzhouensis]TXK31572.1 hypothetical protein FVR03_19770 [Pontibacter qinzhouensis]